MVADNRSIVLDRSHAPDEEDAFQEPVEGDDPGDVEREELEDREHGKDDPVGQPFSVVGLVFRFDSFH